MKVLGRVLSRTSAFVIKELIVALGQPRLMLSVIVGPFLLLMLFGLGFTGQLGPYNVTLVVPNRPNVPKQTSFYSQYFFWQLHLSHVTTNMQAAMTQLRDRRIDGVIVAPPDPVHSLAQNQPATFQVYYNSLNPVVRTQLAGLVYGHTRELNTHIEAAMLSSIFQAAGVPPAAQSHASAVDVLRQQLQASHTSAAQGEINRMLVALAILRLAGGTATPAGGSSLTPAQIDQTEAQLITLQSEVSAQAGLTPVENQQLNALQATSRSAPNVFLAAAQVSPDRLAQPVDYTLQDIAPSSISYVNFYGPFVLALLIQHIAITLSALSVIRERTQGTLELFRVAPVRLGEIIVGKALSFAVILGLLSALLVFLMRAGLRVPLLGAIPWLAAMLALVIAISLAFGFIIAALSRTETQAVQLAMLVLLVSVFFGGLFVPITAVSMPVRLVSYIVPVTEAGIGLQTVMLRGNMVPAAPLEALGLMFVIVAPLAGFALRRSFRV